MSMWNVQVRDDDRMAELIAAGIAGGWITAALKLQDQHELDGQAQLEVAP